MAYSASFLARFRWSGLPFFIASVVAVGGVVTATPALANDYAACVADLLPLELEREAIAAACALAYRPTEVSRCVTGVVEVATVTPRSALAACSRDRRPLEVATCVTDIHNTLPVSDSPSVLDHCHRSLLPERYGQCVTSLATTLPLGTEDSLAQCIAAGYRPENVAPTYIPNR